MSKVTIKYVCVKEFTDGCKFLVGQYYDIILHDKWWMEVIIAQGKTISISRMILNRHFKNAALYREDNINNIIN